MALAELTEAAGLDLVTFQDHPYNAEFLDTWTLLTWVAARTRAPADLRERPQPAAAPAGRAGPGRGEPRPAVRGPLRAGPRRRRVLGRDRRHGRPAADRRAGCRRRCGEAIDVIRGVWDTTRAAGPLRVDGEHYTVPGMPSAARSRPTTSTSGSAPTSRGCCALTGRKADGWLPTLAYLRARGPARPPTGASTRRPSKAGRDPREIRRLLNLFTVDVSSRSRGFLQGPPSSGSTNSFRWSSRTASPRSSSAATTRALIERFGQEVAPALREAVARERARRPGRHRRRSARPSRWPQRHAGHRLRRAARVAAARPSSRATGSTARSAHTYIRTGSPGLVIRPSDAEEVDAALATPATQDVPLSVRSGGHGISGRSTNDGGIVIDRRATRTGRGARPGNAPDPARSGRPLGRRRPGARPARAGDELGRLRRRRRRRPRDRPAASAYLARRHGLTIDHVIAAEIVLADGRLLRVDDEHHPDLFWAVRGAGGNFGIVTAFELEAYAVGNVVFASMRLRRHRHRQLLSAGAALVEAAPRELTSFLCLFRPRQEPPIAQLTPSTPATTSRRRRTR